MITTSYNQLEEAIIELYRSVKVRKTEEIDNFDQSFENLEKDKLRKNNPLVLIEYIKSSIQILVNLKAEETIQERERQKADSQGVEYEETNEYEKLLRKLENDIRTYIKIEHQMKLHSESLQLRIDELEKEKKLYKQKNKQLTEQITKNKNCNPEEISTLKNEITQLQHIVKSYEEHNMKIPELEKKLRTQKTKFEKELKGMETFYTEKIKNISSTQGKTNLEILSLTRERHRDLSRDKSNDHSKTICNEDPDRVNYNYLQKGNTSISNIRSRTQSPKKPSSTARIIKTTAERKKEIDYISNKIDLYKKGIDKKINENIKTMIDDLKVKKPDISTLVMKTLDADNGKNKVNSDLSDILNQKKNVRKNQNSASHRKVDNSKSIISSYRGNSTDKIKHKSNSKTIHTLKDTIKTSSTHIPPINKETLTPSYMTNPKMNNSNSNIILNQNGVPCYNNIHIYTGVNGLKQNDINLRQYIFNKVNNKKNLMTKPQNKSVSHVRSNSTIGHN